MNSRRSFLSLRSFLRSSATYVLASMTVALTCLALFLVRPSLNTSTIALLFLIPVLASTTLWGLGAGILSAILAFLGYNYFFLVPYYTFQVHQSQDILALVIFLLVAILISQLVGRAQKGLEAALRREQESTRLYELSTGLAGVNDLQELASVLAHKTGETFQAKFVQVSVEKIHGQNGLTQAGQGRTPFLVAVGEAQGADQEPLMVAPMETMRGFLGEIRVRRSHSAFEPAEERLLRTFAAQGALAMERAALEQAETRAHVLEESDRLKSALLSSVSHEFRTPLVTIKAAVTSLLSGQVEWDTEARRDLLAAVDEESDLLNYLVGNLLNMSKIESGAMKPNRQWNMLSEILDGVQARMHRVLAHHLLRVNIPDDLPLVPVDYQQIEQVFTNLLSNSVKYAPDGSEIAISARRHGSDAVLVSVTNQGPPVVPEHLDRIFDKFFRITNADRITGTGLGLSICKGVVEAHNGRIWAENLPEGFTFKFTLPIVAEGMRPPRVEAERE